MATYLIGIDFGDGDTTATAWLIGEDRRVRVRFRDTDKEDDYKIRSVIYRKEIRKGIYDYKLEEGPDYVPHSSFKKKVKELSEEGKGIFKHFIQRAYQAMLENNPFGKDGNDFLLYIAAPTSWDEAEKEEYRRFVEEAIGKRVEWVISESDAAYYNKASDKEQNWVLVVDYGSSTIDFTLMQGKKKINVDFLSCRMGARSIEQKLYEAYKETPNYKASFAYFNKKLEDAGKDPIDPAGFLRLDWREGKEYMYTGNKSKVVLSNACVSLQRFANIQLDDGASDDFFEHSFMYPESKVYSEYIAEVKGYFAYVKNRLSQPDYLGEEGMKNLKVIYTGGASRMPWVRAELERLFGQGSVISKEDGQTEASNNTSNVERDVRPEYVVSDGVVKYAKLLYEVEQEVNKAMDEVMGNIGTLQAEVEQQAASVCRDMWKELFKSHSEVQAYCSEEFEDFTIPDDDPENFDKNYYHSSIKNFSLSISKKANDQMRKDMRKIKEKIADNLRTVLSENLSKCFKHLKTINLEKQNISVQITKLPDVDSNFSLSPEKAIAELSDKLVGRGNTKYGKYKFQKGTYRKARSTSERVQIVDYYVNLINDVNYVPYDKGKIKLIRKCIYESTLHGIVEAVQEHLMFKPCGYGMEKKLRDRFGMLITVAMGKEVLGHSYVGIAPKEGDVVYCKDKEGVVKSSTVCSFRQVPTGTYYMLLEDDALADCEGCWCYTK